MNQTIFFFFYNLAHQSALLDGLIVFCAVYLPYIAVIIAGIFLLFHFEVFGVESPAQVLKEKKKEILMVLLSVILAGILVEFFKVIFQAPRPINLFSGIRPLFSETGFAFPSGHATFFSALAFSVFFLHEKAGYFFIFLAFVIGVARIAAGVHSPLDILGGFVLGFAVSWVFNYFLNR